MQRIRRDSDLNSAIDVLREVDAFTRKRRLELALERHPANHLHAFNSFDLSERSVP